MPKRIAKAHKDVRHHVALDVACGAVSTADGLGALNPTDVIKTRRQIVGFRRSLDMARRRVRARARGPAGLWLPGLQATVLRELLYSGWKGLYPYARDAIARAKRMRPARPAPGVPSRRMTGFGGSLCANAVDVVKVQQFGAAATGASSPRCATSPGPRAARPGVPASAHKSFGASSP